jgi:hypothetical protein
MNNGYIEIPCPIIGGKAYRKSACNIIVSNDNGLWHLSISRTDRYPSWGEIYRARYDLLPDEITMAMYLPPKAEYVNLHPNCFHLYQV